MIKKSEILKSAVKMQLFEILLGRFFKDRKSSLPVNYTQKEVATKITFSWGYAFCLGINILFFVFFVFRHIQEMIPVIILGALTLLISLLGSSILSCLYIFAVSLRKIREQEKAAKKLPYDKKSS